MIDNADQKLVILGFDGATPQLLEKWVESGDLPNIKRIMKSGVYGPLRSVPNMSSPAAWSTFATGKNPGKHGIFRFTERKQNSYSYKYVNATYRKAKTFWEILCGEDATRTGCIVNVPMTYPSEEINGCMISGFDAPGADSPGACYPASIIEELREKCGSYHITRDFADLLRKGDNWRTVADHMLATMEMRYKCMTYLMEKYDWQVFAVVFGETDHAQHFFWKFIDDSHPDYNEREAQIYGDTILRIYQKMDDICGRIMEENPTANIMIVSDHGGAINTRGADLVCDWLSTLELFSWSSEKTSMKSAFSNGVSFMARKAYQLANRRLLIKTKLRLIRFMPGLRESVESAISLGGIDWLHTKAYCDGAQDDIWINLTGRDSLGVVSENEYDDLCDFIVAELKDAVDLTTGLPIVESVFKRSSAYHGEYVEHAADITVNWKPGAVITGIKSKHSKPGQSAAKWEWPVELPTGGHSRDGIFLAMGPFVKKDIIIENAQLVDVAPTVLYFFDEGIPQDMDGKVLTDIFEASHLASRPPITGIKTDALKEEQKDLYSEEDVSVIEQRLRDLGYI
ncbi:MAG: alkaline phosphatase family protein [Thermoleophilia bacterium]